MDELNHTQSVETLVEDGFDTLTAVNMTEAFSFAQVDEDGDLHNVVVGPEQAEALIKLLVAFLA